MDQIELRKQVEIILEKKGFGSDIRAKVCLIIDESGSMADMFRNGTVSNIVDRALAVGYKFDDDGSIDVWSFSDTFKRRPEAVQGDHGKYVTYRMLNGSTIYHNVLRAAAEDYFVSNTIVKKAKSFFGFKLGEDQVETKTAGTMPAFVIFITDGEPNSSNEAIVEVGKILKQYPSLFVQFIGVGGTRFPTLQEIEQRNSNCSLAVIHDGDTDEIILDKFLNAKAKAVLGA